MAIGRVNHQDHLNRMAPAAKGAKLGDVIYDLINALNDLRKQNVALLAKLDAAGVAGGTNTAQVSPTLPAVRLPEQR